jgi:hypothetical protein
MSRCASAGNQATRTTRFAAFNGIPTAGNAMRQDAKSPVPRSGRNRAPYLNSLAVELSMRVALTGACGPRMPSRRSNNGLLTEIAL